MDKKEAQQGGSAADTLWMSSVLFVDDEPLMREFYRELADKLDGSVEISTAAGGDEALRLLAAKPVEIVVSDLEMPEMHGGVFLTQVERLYPQTMRIVLSGLADQAAVARCLMFGHRYFLKPLKLEQLASALKRIVRLREVMGGEKIKRIIGRADALPTPPETYLRLLDILDQSEASVLQVAEVLGSNSVQAAKFLEIVNAGGFAPYEVPSLLSAVQIVGIEVVRAIILALHTKSFCEKRIKSKKFLEAHWNHSLDIAAACKRLACVENQDPLRQSECFTVGLLHDVGKLILASHAEDTYFQMLDVAETEPPPLYKREKIVYGASHAEVGAHLLGLWGLPDSIIDAVESHHSMPGEAGQFSPTLCIYAAQTLRRNGNLSSDGEDLLFPSDLIDRVPLWKKVLAA